MTSSAAGKKSRRDAACALPTDALREAKRKPLENVGIFSGPRPGTARAPRQNPFAQPSLLFLCPSGQSFRITLGKKKKPLNAVGLSSSRTARGATSARRNIRLFSLKRCAFQTPNFPSVFGRTLVLWQLRLPIPRGAGILGSLAAMTPLDAHSREAAPRCAIARAPFFLKASLLFSAFYVFCLYDNPSGVTYPLFTAGLLGLYVIFLKREDGKLKKSSVFYMTAIFLLRMGFS